MTITVSFKESAEGDHLVSAAVEKTLPGFWAFLKTRHPQFRGYGADDGPPLGYIHAIQVHEALAETIPVYVKELQKRQRAAVLENVPEADREMVAYALDLATQ